MDITYEGQTLTADGFDIDMNSYADSDAVVLTVYTARKVGGFWETDTQSPCLTIPTDLDPEEFGDESQFFMLTPEGFSAEFPTEAAVIIEKHLTR